MEYLALAIGIVIGFMVALLYLKASSGTLKIDQTNPEKDVYLLELDDLDNIAKKKRIILKVDSHADLSQK